MQKYLENLIKLGECEQKYTDLNNEFEEAKTAIEAYKEKCETYENEIKLLNDQLGSSPNNKQLRENKEDSFETKKRLNELI